MCVYTYTFCQVQFYLLFDGIPGGIAAVEIKHREPMDKQRLKESGFPILLNKGTTKTLDGISTAADIKLLTYMSPPKSEVLYD